MCFAAEIEKTPMMRWIQHIIKEGYDLSHVVVSDENMYSILSLETIELYKEW